MSKRGASAWGAWCMAALLLCLTACGGGGGGGNSAGSVTITMVTAAEATMVEGNAPENYVLTARLSYGPGTDGFYVLVEGDERLLADASPYGGGDYLYLSLRYVPDLPAGDYETTLTIHACSDEQCTRELGPAVQVPLKLHVLPNIRVQERISLTRTGRETAPSLSVPVTVPAAAGTVNLTSNIDTWNALAISFDGAALRVDTQQLPAGTYTATATLWSSTDSRYNRTVAIEYTVLAPPGGEQSLTVSPDGWTTLSLPQGSRAVQQVRVTRPTWTDAWSAPVLTGSHTEMGTVRDLGNDVYEVTIDTAGKVAGRYELSLLFDAGPTGGVRSAPFIVSVEDVFSLPSFPAGFEVGAATTAAELARSIPIAMVDGSSRRWTATSTSPYLRIASSTGMTGTDALQVSMDPALLEERDVNLTLPFTIAVDVPGSLPRAYELTGVNQIPRVRRAVTHTLVGGSGRAYVQGLFSAINDVNWRSRLQVSGATLVAANLLEDMRFLGSKSVLALDLAGLTPGQDVTVRYNSVLAPSQVQFQVLAPFTSGVAYQALPFAAYRPGQFSQGLASLYFAGPDSVFRWAYAAGSWTLSQAALPGVIDVVPSPDESVLYATSGSLLRALQPQSFAVQATGDLSAPREFLSWLSFDAAVPTGLQGLAFSADGRALASVGMGQPDAGHGLAWICSSPNSENGLSLLTTQLGTCDPGTGAFNDAQGFGFTRSPNGHTVVAVGHGGAQWRYRAVDRVWTERAALPAGVQVVAVADDGVRWVRSDGLLMSGDASLGNLASAVPVGYEAGGYGLSAAGGYGLVYGYRRTGSGAAERATDATVWIVDLTNVGVTGITGAPLLDTVSLPQPVGCTAALASGETCAHRASFTVAPGQRAAFVIGPRGVAALPLPSGATEAQVLRTGRTASNPRALSTSPQRTLRRGMRRAAPSGAGSAAP